MMKFGKEGKREGTADPAEWVPGTLDPFFATLVMPGFGVKIG